MTAIQYFNENPDKDIESVLEGYAYEKNKALEAELLKWKIALCSLTPGGSEYANDPERCVQTVKEMRDTIHGYLAEKIKELQQLKKLTP